MHLNSLGRDILFFIMLIFMSAFYFDGILDKGPLGVHTWRQADCLSLTQNYAEGADFLEPEMHILLADEYTTGKSAGEFPILYYTVGKIWSAFGQSYISYRLFYLFITLISLFLLYKALLIALNDWFWSTLITLLVFTSPNFVAYSTSFLTDAPSICFVFIALYFLTRYATSQHLKWFYFSMAFFALAGLIKTSSLIAFIFLLFIYALERFPLKSLGNRKLFSRPIAEGLGFAIAIILIFSWYVYADYYNGIHHFKYTFNSIYPMWEVPSANLNKILEGIKNSTSQSFFSRAILLALLFLGIFNIFLIKRINFFAYSASLIVSIGCIAYFTLWFPLMENHNYYFVILVILVPAIITPFALFVKNENPNIFTGRLTRLFLAIFLMFNFLYSNEAVQLSLKGRDKTYPFIGNYEFIKGMRYMVWSADYEWTRFERMQPYLLEIGVDKDAKVVSMPDPSFNVSLFYADRKGWTNFSNIDADKMNLLISKGASYLFVSNENTLEEAFLQPFLADQIGEFEGIKIYKLPNTENTAVSFHK